MNDESKAPEQGVGGKESEAPKSGKNKSLLFLVLAVLVAVVAGYLLMANSGLSQSVAQTVVDEWVAQFNEGNDQQNIRYERLEVAGKAAERYVVIYNPTLTSRYEDDDGLDDEFELTTEKLLLRPQSITFDAFKAEITDAIIVRDNKDEVRIASSTPLIFDYKIYQKEGMTLTELEHVLPQNFTVEDPTEESKLIVSMEEGGRLSAVSAPDYRSKLDLQINAADIQAIEEGNPDHSLAISAISINSNIRNFDKDNGAMRSQIDVKDVFSTEAEMPYGAISLIADLDYSGPVPNETRKADDIDWSQEKALVDLRQLRISATDVSLDAKLNFQTGTGDFLPIGSGQIDVNNFAFIRDELRAEEMLGEEEETLLNALLLQITGSNIDELQDLSIPIKREDASSLTIGNATFEELFAIFLTGGKIVKPGDVQLSPHDTPPLDVVEEEAEEATDEQ